MRRHIAVGLPLALTLLTSAPLALSAPQSKQTPKKAAADPLAKAIIGTWKKDFPGQNGSTPAHMKVTFNKDGTAIQYIEAPGHKVRQWLKYQIANGWITQSLVKAEDNGKPFTPPNPGTHKLRLHIKGDTLSIDLYEGRSDQLVLQRVKN